MKTFGKAMVISLSLGAGHFAYQLFQFIPDYTVAAERTFFQAAAIMVWILITKERK